MGDWSPAGRNRSGSTAGSDSGSGAHREEKGIDRLSRCPRVLAVFTRIRKIQVRSDDRPWNPSRPFRTPSQASCTTSSAMARVGTYILASRSIAGPYRSTSIMNATSFPARRAWTSCRSSGDATEPSGSSAIRESLSSVRTYGWRGGCSGGRYGRAAPT